MSEELTKALLQFSWDNGFTLEHFGELSKEAIDEYYTKLAQYKI